MPKKMPAESFVPEKGWVRHDELGFDSRDLAAAIEFADDHDDSEVPISRWILDDAKRVVHETMDRERVTYEAFSRLAVEEGTILGCTAEEIRAGVDTDLMHKILDVPLEEHAALFAGADGLGQFPPGPLDDAGRYWATAEATQNGVIVPTHRFQHGHRIFEATVTR